MPLNLVTDVWYLSGPTASGKTAVGIELARRLGAEIISMDSMAIYAGMDIGTAKPTAAERAAVPHHQIDIVQPHQEYSVAEYLADARRLAEGIAARGRQVLFVGGTPLYLKALLRGLFEGPPADWQLRGELEQVAQSEGSTALHRRLAAVDPASAARLHENDTRRLIRALEVYEKTGRPMSHWQQQFDVGHVASECKVFVLDWPREDLYRRINGRVDAMFAAGLVDEVQNLLAQPLPLSRTAGQAVGYRETIEHLQGQRGLEETVELVKLRTRQFAKRQLTWFRSLSECRTMEVTERMTPEEIARQIEAEGKRENR